MSPKIFVFKSFDTDSYEEFSSITFENYERKKIFNVFLMEEENLDTLVVLTNEYNERLRRNSKIIPLWNLFSKRKTDINCRKCISLTKSKKEKNVTKIYEDFFI